MRLNNSICAFAIAFSCAAGVVSDRTARAFDWIVAPSYYSHDPSTHQRVRQFAPIGPFYTYNRGDVQRSVYRQTRSSIQAGGSADHMHIVEEWGKPVRPYGEWRFPYRPYSVPYDAWGPEFPSLQGHRDRGFVAPPFAGAQFGGFGVPYAGQPGVPYAGQPGVPNPGPGGPGLRRAAPPFRPYPGYQPQPWDDGRYPRYDSDGPYGYPDLLQRPDPFRRPLRGVSPPAPAGG